MAVLTEWLTCLCPELYTTLDWIPERTFGYILKQQTRSWFPQMGKSPELTPRIPQGLPWASVSSICIGGRLSLSPVVSRRVTSHLRAKVPLEFSFTSPLPLHSPSTRLSVSLATLSAHPGKLYPKSALGSFPNPC